jgi:4-amino-4-deoxy-L-arabinose transferase-like glycosyltransferase
MLRRSSTSGIVLLVAALALLFVPLAAAASSRSRSAQTLTLLVLTCALSGYALVWLTRRLRGYVRALHLGLGALCGAYGAVLLLGVVRDFAGEPRQTLLARLLIIGALDAAGLWLFTIALRRAFPRRARGSAAAAIVLLAVGLFPGPALLMQPRVEGFNLVDQRTQLHAGFLYWTTGAVLLVAPFLALMTLPGDWFERWWTAATERVMAVPDRSFMIGLVVTTLFLAIFFTLYSFDARPTTADEIAQLWHARMLVAGRLALPPDPNPEFFAIDNIIDRPYWMSQFPIGGPASLSIGVLLGAVWLLNPVLTALTALNVYRLAQRAYGEAQARAAAAVFAVSPMVLIMGATHMNHMPTAWLVTLALAALPLWISSPDDALRRRAGALIGAALGAAIAIRPLDGVVATLIVALVMLAFAARDRSRVSSLTIAMATGAIPVVLLLIANWKTTGSPLRFGYEVLWGANHSLGLHDDPTGHPHTAWRALLLGVKYAVQLNWIVLAWPVPILLIVASGLVLARRPRRWDVLLLALVGAQLVAYAFYWHDGQFVGPRFLFTAIPALLILTARAPFIAHQRLRGVWWRIAMVTIPVCVAVAWLRSMPPFGVQGLAKEFRESRSRLKLDPPREVASGAVQNALIFVQEGAATRLLHRLWGIGVSRPDAARLLATADACSLLEALRAEERRAPDDTAGRLARIEQSIKPFRESKANVRAPDPNFHVTDSASVTRACNAEVALDSRLRNSIAYGPMLLQNRFDESGRIAGPVVYVMNLGDHNEVLRRRFADRHWYRYEIPRSRPDSAPVLVPYDSAR